MNISIYKSAKSTSLTNPKRAAITVRQDSLQSASLSFPSIRCCEAFWLLARRPCYCPNNISLTFCQSNRSGAYPYRPGDRPGQGRVGGKKRRVRVIGSLQGITSSAGANYLHVHQSISKAGQKYFLDSHASKRLDYVLLQGCCFEFVNGAIDQLHE